MQPAIYLKKMGWNYGQLYLNNVSKGSIIWNLHINYHYKLNVTLVILTILLSIGQDEASGIR